jgi:hypothetical protein
MNIKAPAPHVSAPRHNPPPKAVKGKAAPGSAPKAQGASPVKSAEAATPADTVKISPAAAKPTQAKEAKGGADGDGK